MDAELPEDAEPEPGFLTTELANTLTHGVGCAASIVVLVLTVVYAAMNDSPRQVVACSIYGATLVFLYLTSTLYHAIRHPRAKRILQIIDHSAIYLLIAGTYTPFTLIVLEGGLRWSLFGVIWGLAALGIVFKVFFTGRLGFLSLAVYLAMGWLALVMARPLLDRLPGAAVGWLLAGGLVYSAGIVFYACKRIPHHHAIWHVFVMGGSTCHFFAVMFYVLRMPA